MMGTRGAAAKVEMKQVKKETHERWKVLMWGLAKEKSLNTLALCSESTGKANFAVVSVGTIGEATEKAKVCSLPVTPCMELPGSPKPSMSPIFAFLVNKKMYNVATELGSTNDLVVK